MTDRCEKYCQTCSNAYDEDECPKCEIRRLRERCERLERYTVHLREGVHDTSTKTCNHYENGECDCGLDVAIAPGAEATR